MKRPDDDRSGIHPAEPVEIAAYYVVSEALTNTAKHACNSAAEVKVAVGEGLLRVCTERACE